MVVQNSKNFVRTKSSIFDVKKINELSMILRNISNLHSTGIEIHFRCNFVQLLKGFYDSPYLWHISQNWLDQTSSQTSSENGFLYASLEVMVQLWIWMLRPVLRFSARKMKQRQLLYGFDGTFGSAVVTALVLESEGVGFDSRSEGNIKREALEISPWYNNGQYA